jgi:uncharacterized membrane-anchored protein
LGCRVWRQRARPSPSLPTKRLRSSHSIASSRSGDIAIPDAKATLHLGGRYYFVPAGQAKEVVTKIWGNPPDMADDVLGIVFERNATIYDNVWGAVVTFEKTGYVSDKDASSQDYNALIAQIRNNEAESNAQRKKAGFASFHLIGWAQQPTYNPTNHSLVWARDIQFSDSKTDTLNYDVRLLGREGVLSLNMVSQMPHLNDVRAAAATFARSATFAKGAAYADYDASTDKTAEYGLAGLVAAGVGVAAVKKLGLAAVLLAFGKKFVILLLAGGAAAWRYAKRLFGRKDDDSVA